LQPFPYLGFFKQLLPYEDIIRYHYSIPKDVWTDRCSPLDGTVHSHRPTEEVVQSTLYSKQNASYKELVVKHLNFFSDEWFSAVGALNTDYQAKIFCTQPGNTEPPHKDFFPGFLGHTNDKGDIYNQKEIDQLGKKIIRCWIPLMDSKIGHLLYSDNYALSSWKLGDVYELPSGTSHGFVNAGREDRYVLVFTGWRS